MADCVQVIAPSRLHFGMVSIGRSGQRQFGGLGAMIDRPGVRLRVCRADSLRATGPLADRALAFARRFCTAARLSETGYSLEVLEGPHEHVGLGVGTQLALSVAAGIAKLAQGERGDVQRLAELVGRGERSAIGTHGFRQGGMLLDAGKLAGEPISPLHARIAIPPAWRFAVIIPKHERGVHGLAERHAFQALPTTSAEVAGQLHRSAETLMQATAAGEFAVVAEALYRFNRAAGELFARYQQGAYANERVRRLVEALRGAGVAGVGQSSWGPTVFALTADELSAHHLIEYCRTLSEAEDCDSLIGAPQNRGAHLELE